MRCAGRWASRDRLPPPDLRPGEVDLDAVDPVGAADDLAGGEVGAFGDFAEAFVDRGVVAAFREDVDEIARVAQRVFRLRCEEERRNSSL